ncbi:hypothetical protein [Hyphobacterium sp.]|uniref:hypothetical protein n=1 Tax=Hyphobacterium sp. TaxID=2004662 RepID=UPI003B525125
MTGPARLLALLFALIMSSGSLVAQETAGSEDSPDASPPVDIGIPFVVDIGTKHGFRFELNVEAPGLYEFTVRHVEEDIAWTVNDVNLPQSRIHLAAGTHSVSLVGIPLENGPPPVATVFLAPPIGASEPNDFPAEASPIDGNTARVFLAPAGDWDWLEWAAPEPGRIIIFNASTGDRAEIALDIGMDGPDGLVAMPPPEDTAHDTYGPWRVDAAGPVRFRIAAPDGEDFVAVDLEFLFAPDTAASDDPVQIHVVGIELDPAVEDRLDAIVASGGGRFVNVSEAGLLAEELTAISSAIEDDLDIAPQRGGSAWLWPAVLLLLLIGGAVILLRMRRSKAKKL